MRRRESPHGSSLGRVGACQHFPRRTRVPCSDPQWPLSQLTAVAAVPAPPSAVPEPAVLSSSRTLALQRRFLPESGPCSASSLRTNTALLPSMTTRPCTTHSATVALLP